MHLFFKRLDPVKPWHPNDKPVTRTANAMGMEVPVDIQKTQ